MMTYGNFSEDGARYEINTPDTPHSWSNYLFNDDYHMRVSQTAQGVCRAVAPVFMEFNRRKSANTQAGGT